MGLGQKICYCFCSEKVNELKHGCDFFNKHIKPMFAWYSIDVVTVKQFVGYLVVRVSGVCVLFNTDSHGVWIASITIEESESAEVWDQQRNYIERFCCVIDGYRRNDAGELEKIAG